MPGALFKVLTILVTISSVSIILSILQTRKQFREISKFVQGCEQMNCRKIHDPEAYALEYSLLLIPLH